MTAGRQLLLQCRQVMSTWQQSLACRQPPQQTAISRMQACYRLTAMLTVRCVPLSHRNMRQSEEVWLPSLRMRALTERHAAE